MSNDKETGSKLFEDLIEFETKSQYVEESPNAEAPKPQKRKKSSAPAMQEEQMAKLMGVNYKKRKVSDSQSVDTPQRVRDTFMKQIETRKKCNDLIINNLSNILTELDDDYATRKENQVRCEQVTRELLKSIQQSNAAQKQKLKSLKEIHDTLKKGCEELNSIQKQQTEKLTEDVEHDFETLEQEVIAETKRNSWATLRETFFNAMKKDL